MPEGGSTPGDLGRFPLSLEHRKGIFLGWGDRRLLMSPGLTTRLHQKLLKQPVGAWVEDGLCPGSFRRKES